MRKILNKEVAVFPFLIGNRYFDRRDFDEFSMNFSVKSGYSPLYRDYIGRNYNNFKKTLNYAEKQATDRIKNNGEAIVVFPILTMIAAKEAKRLIECFERLRVMRNKVFVYPIIWDDHNDCYLYNSGTAAYIFINSDAPSAGGRRLKEYIQRIMGYDLPDGFFPEYSQEDANKIARHINHENFNTWRRKAFSIPKYPIIDGKPYFPALYTKLKCPQCGHENEVYRGQLDEKGGAEVRCYGSRCYEKIYFDAIGNEFDPWPDFVEYQNQAGAYRHI